MAATSKAKLSLKLLVDTKNKRVLFAEAGKDFVDFLFHLLHLPVATVVRLLTKQNMVGTLGNIYESIENLSEANIQPNHTKYSLLKPIPPFSATQVRLSLDDSVPTKMYTCPHNNKARIMRPGPYGYKCYTHFHSYVADDERAVCPSCKVSLSKEIQYVAAANEVPGRGGFVKGTGTYMVMDDLVVNPMSTLSGITILNKLCVKDVGALEEMVVDFGMPEPQTAHRLPLCLSLRAPSKGRVWLQCSSMAPKGDVAKKADPKAQALKAAKAVKSASTTFKKKAKKIRTSVTFHRPKTLKKDRNPKYPRVSAPGRNKLDHYQILKYPLTTESAMKKIEDNNTLVFIVDIRADKKKIKAAVKKMYDIQTKKVNTLIRPDGTKKAYVRLTPDYDALDVANKIGII
ncbi:hypothetical protein Vadar_014094 [Vaccinium darrowii]|uniref:Uncharacterized protein n=1 Tax=Vaccinium darrowii TaxID=229202 RepID=A0ACB7XHC0_9ERIC|nr:hypothetical protein Vadar_014094 [Vaccinium darrowii]